MKKHVLVKKSVYKWAKLFKKERKNIFDKDRPGRPTGVRASTMINSIDNTIQSDRRVKMKDTAHSLNISVGIAHEIIHEDLGYPKVSCSWVPKMLSQEHEQKRVELSQQYLCRFEKEGDDFLKKVITCG